MPRLIWTAEALRDVRRLQAFLVLKNPDAARRAVAIIRQGVRVLGEHPEAGRLIDNLPPDYREWPIAFGAGGYVARYRIVDSAVFILAVRHGRERPS